MPVGNSPLPAIGAIMVPAGYTAALVHAGQWLNTPVTARLVRGTRVRIYCTVQGGLVAGPTGHQSTLWDRIDGGYIPDVDVDTGTQQPVRGNCGT
ncbi:hypothetical protein NE236_34445 [Actinoallomurus purpureus]|uniref:hypothetical protein n=1 Tax=Actinoallomurus purpureus TaxID=478114 RepID=UPI00209377BA|nr:hypothetical protein [Actinoallomurus purpureus]MCO6010081.1 hypothetical protein [Actinoallomurus purpureus]